MKKILILVISLILTISLLTGCDNSQSEEPEEVDEIEAVEVVGGTKIDYAREDEQDIFGDISKEEIIEIVDEIFEMVSNDEDFENNIDSIIEEVFKKHGIRDEDNLDAAKSKLKISKTE